MQHLVRFLLVLSLMVMAHAASAQAGMSKRHLNLQDKQTRKRIKRHTKRADRRGTNRHEDGFFRRMFGG
jgi:ABC-type Fe3+-citrate transport system substrate-binding protein